MVSRPIKHAVSKAAHNSKNSAKISDRRLASGKAAARYLLSEQQKQSVPAAQAPQASPSAVSSSAAAEYTVSRQVGDKKWTDDSLLAWDPSHYRLFVGNLSPEVRDETLYNSFCQYATLSKVKVPMVHSNNKNSGAAAAVNKGYGFVAFSSADDYLRAFKEMNGKYVGQFPIQLKRAQTEIKVTKKKDRRRKHGS